MKRGTLLMLPLAIAVGCGAPNDDPPVVIEIDTPDPAPEHVEVDIEEDDEPDVVVSPPVDPRWEQLASRGPAAREHTVMWIDEGDPDSMYLFGGYLFEPAQFTPAYDMWRLDLTTDTWSEVEQTGQAPATGGEIAATGTPSVSLYVGGTGNDFEMPTSFAYVETSKDVATWTVLEPFVEDDPFGLQLGALVWDQRRSRHLVTGGFAGLADGMQLLPLSIVFELFDAPGNALGVGTLEAAHAPSDRYGLAWALDAKADRLVVFSGAQAPLASDPVHPATDTWAFDLDSDVGWAEIRPTGDAPIGRRNGCHAYDPVGHRLFVLGGTADGRTSVRGLHVLDLEEGAERWSNVDLPNTPPARASCTAVYDAARQRILFGFGNSEVAIYNDVWALVLDDTTSAPEPTR